MIFAALNQIISSVSLIPSLEWSNCSYPFPMKRLLVLLSLAIAVSLPAADKNALKTELVRAEAEFCRQAAVLGIREAFLANMADQVFEAGSLALSRTHAIEVSASRSIPAQILQKQR